jgi:hypothetical protein
MRTPWRKILCGPSDLSLLIIAIPNTTNVVLGGINNRGDITGTLTTLSNGDQPGFLGTKCHF